MLDGSQVVVCIIDVLGIGTIILHLLLLLQDALAGIGICGGDAFASLDVVLLLDEFLAFYLVAQGETFCLVFVRVEPFLGQVAFLELILVGTNIRSRDRLDVVLAIVGIVVDYRVALLEGPLFDKHTFWREVHTDSLVNVALLIMVEQGILDWSIDAKVFLGVRVTFLERRRFA